MKSAKIVCRKVFISSTVYDLRDERDFIRSLLEGFNRIANLRFECLVSDHPDFPISPSDRALKHSYDICIDNVARADYFILLLKQRYGAPIVKYKESKISITHMEFREAHRLKIPRFVLVDQRTWDAKQAHNKGQEQDFIPEKQKVIFDFLDEIRYKKKGNWLDFYRNEDDIKVIVSSFLDSYDDSRFIGEI